MYRSILSEMYALVVENIQTTLHIAGAWVAINIVLNVADALTDFPLLGVVFSVAAVVCGLLASGSIATAWHRFGLLNEQPDRIHLRFGRLELKVLSRILLAALVSIPVLVVALIPVIILFMVIEPIPFDSLTSVLKFVIIFGFVLVYLYFYFRICFIVPAAAVGHQVGLKKSFALSKGYFLPVLLAGLTFELPVLLTLGFFAGLLQAFGILPTFGGQVILTIAIAMVEIFCMSVTLAAVTIAYRRAIEKLWAENPSDPVFAES